MVQGLPPGVTVTEPEPTGAERYARLRWDLRRAARHLQRPTIARCGLSTPGGLIAAHASQSGAYSWSGAHLCHSPHSCPACAGAIALGRSREIADVSAEQLAAGGEIWLTTLTLRHRSTHSLKDLCDVLTEAWRRYSSGRWGQAWRGRLGVEAHARGFEVTWGMGSGWHPHYHIALWQPPELQQTEEAERARQTMDRAQASEEEYTRRSEASRRRAAVLQSRRRFAESAASQRRALEYAGMAQKAKHKAVRAGRLLRALVGTRDDLRLEMARRWREAVRAATEALEQRAILEDNEAPEVAAERFAGIEPDTSHGFDMRRTTSAEYCAKLGFEVAGVGKAGRIVTDSERLSPWELVDCATIHGGHYADAWREYTDARHGERSLTWSRGARFAQTTDEELCQRYMRGDSTVGFVEAPAYLQAEKEGAALSLAKWIHTNLEAANEWLRERGHAPATIKQAAPPTPAPRYVSLALRRGQLEGGRFEGEHMRKVATSARISAWSAQRRKDRASREAWSALDEHSRIMSGDWVPADFTPTGEAVPARMRIKPGGRPPPAELEQLDELDPSVPVDQWPLW